MAIERFRENYYFLSNMFPLEHGVVTPGGVEVPCVEIAYLQERYAEEKDRNAILVAPDGFAAKALSNQFMKEERPVLPEWNHNKVAIMRIYVAQKFDRNPELAKKLLATGDQEIYEGNPWRDTFWGVYPVGSRNGQNWLGRIHMEARRLLREREEQLAPAAVFETTHL